MAPLKRFGGGVGSEGESVYPCLKGHGPIEALDDCPDGLEPALYPCLKGHGPIEAHHLPLRGRECIAVSMPERAWPH